MMNGQDMENLIARLDALGYIFPQYRIDTNDGRLHRIGRGGSACVYRMSKAAGGSDQEGRYALKVTMIDSDARKKMHQLYQAVKCQKRVAEQTRYVEEILDVKYIEIPSDNDTDIIVHNPEEEDAVGDGVVLEFILTYNLQCVLKTDRYNNVRVSIPKLDTEAEVINFAIEIGTAIQISHNNNILHRDIKLENIFWNPEYGIYQLGDYGAAGLTMSGNARTIIGTRGYQAPEIYNRSVKAYSYTADIYSFGMTLYLLLNNLKFPGNDIYNPTEVQYNARFSLPAPSGAGVELTRIIRKMCAYYPEDRYQNMQEVLTELANIGKHRGTIYQLTTFADIVTEKYNSCIQKISDYDINKVHINLIQDELLSDKRIGYGKYNLLCGVHIVILSVLYAMLLAGMDIKTDVITNMYVLIFCGTVLLEAVFKSIGEFQIMCGIAAGVLGIYASWHGGIDFILISLFVCLIVASPIIETAGALGTYIYYISLCENNLEWLEWSCNHNITWLVIVLLLVIIDRHMYIRSLTSERRYSSYIIKKALYMLIIMLVGVAGIIVSVLSLAGVAIPQLISELHMFRTALITLVILFGSFATQDIQ